MSLDFSALLVAIPIVLASLVLHELGHAGVAALLGDHTARNEGRLTLNPLKHLDPLGTIFILITMQVGFGFGWAKPVRVNPLNLKYGPKRGMALVAAAGPGMNVLIALVAVIVIQTLGMTAIPVDAAQRQTLEAIGNGLVMVILTNIGLAVFNMLPIPPLDGSKVLTALLPDAIAYRYLSLDAWGFGILMAAMTVESFGRIPLLSSVMVPAARGLLNAITTISLAPAELLASFFA